MQKKKLNKSKYKSRKGFFKIRTTIISKHLQKSEQYTVSSWFIIYCINITVRFNDALIETVLCSPKETCGRSSSL